uniref:Uncharacterized protein n=1 Tax=Accipiter nisus TaxID=211598 RepID=A0A8B9MVW9_9AVES
EAGAEAALLLPHSFWGVRGLLPYNPAMPGGGGGAAAARGQWFYEVDVATAWGEWLQYHGFLRDVYRDNMVAAIFTLSCGGGVRFEGQEHWIRPESCWRPEVLRLHDIPVVALDLSSSPLTYNGLDNLVPLTWLQRLDLSRCPHLDNWLSVACCPHVTERGLATLHHLQELWCLDVAGVQAPSPGLVCILLEKMLSGCQILGMDLRDSMVNSPSEEINYPLKEFNLPKGGLFPPSKGVNPPLQGCYSPPLGY